MLVKMKAHATLRLVAYNLILANIQSFNLSMKLLNLYFIIYVFIFLKLCNQVNNLKTF